jgi:hypothetical protein
MRTAGLLFFIKAPHVKRPNVLNPSFEAGNGIFLTDNDDVASTFTLPREYARQGAWLEHNSKG